MASKVSVKDVIDDSAKIERVWDENGEFTLKGLTREEYKTLRAQVMMESTQADDLRRQLDEVTNSCGVKALQLSKHTTRARTGMRGYFGPDSTEYEQAGGTRSSERKPPKPRAPKNPPTSP